MLAKGDAVRFSYKLKEYSDLLVKGKGHIRDVFDSYCTIDTLFGLRSIPKHAIVPMKQPIKKSKRRGKKIKKTKRRRKA